MKTELTEVTSAVFGYYPPQFYDWEDKGPMFHWIGNTVLVDIVDEKEKVEGVLLSIDDMGIVLRQDLSAREIFVPMHRIARVTRRYDDTKDS